MSEHINAILSGIDEALKEQAAFEAHRAAVATQIAHRALDGSMLEEEAFEATLCGSRDEMDDAIRAFKLAHNSPNSHTSPNFYV